MDILKLPYLRENCLFTKVQKLLVPVYSVYFILPYIYQKTFLFRARKKLISLRMNTHTLDTVTHFGHLSAVYARRYTGTIHSYGLAHAPAFEIVNLPATTER